MSSMHFIMFKAGTVNDDSRHSASVERVVSKRHVHLDQVLNKRLDIYPNIWQLQLPSSLTLSAQQRFSSNTLGSGQPQNSEKCHHCQHPQEEPCTTTFLSDMTSLAALDHQSCCRNVASSLQSPLDITTGSIHSTSCLMIGPLSGTTGQAGLTYGENAARESRFAARKPAKEGAGGVFCRHISHASLAQF